VGPFAISSTVSLRGIFVVPRYFADKAAQERATEERKSRNKCGNSGRCSRYNREYHRLRQLML
jgi:hypothetical protein